MYVLTRIFSEKLNKFIFYFTFVFWSLWFSAQYVVKGFFDFYISFSVLQIADQVTSFLGKAVIETVKRLPGIILLCIPLILVIIFKRKIYFKRTNGYKIGMALIMLLFSGIGYVYSLNIEKEGIINTFFIDSYRFIFGFEEKIYDNNEEKYVETTYEPNILNIDFDSLLNDYASNNKVTTLTNYIKDKYTYQNEYTGKFKGKNLILFMGESFNEIAVRKDITPTLYKLANNGFVFSNYYTPTIYSTIGGEFQELTGLYANFSSLKAFRNGTNSFPYGIGNLFKNEGYNVYAYHNNSYAFQDRNVYLKTLGFDNFLACYNGLEKRINCRIWPQSDVEMIDSTTNDYINSDKPFMVFYATVSGHAGYSFSENAMARKHKEEIEKFNLGYSEGPLSYLAANMELDDALESLINKLKDAGKLEDTVIALVGDHYPYELSVDEINEISSYKKDAKIEINRSNFILYNSAMKNVNISKVGSSIDVLPTIYNLFNLKYDSRLIIGTDLLSTSDGLAMFDNRSWVTDKGTYFTATGEFIKKSDVSDDYVNKQMQIVNNKINLSSYFMDTNYYNIVSNYVK